MQRSLFQIHPIEARFRKGAGHDRLQEFFPRSIRSPSVGPRVINGLSARPADPVRDPVAADAHPSDAALHNFSLVLRSPTPTTPPIPAPSATASPSTKRAASLTHIEF